MPLPDLPPEPPAAWAAATEVRLSAESVRVADQNRMGLVGLHLLRPLGDTSGGSPGGRWVGGISVLGATHGDRGGFFAWGVSGAYQARSGPWQAEAGLFVGGGGGSPGWVGGGLMLRPEVMLTHRWRELGVGFGVSQVWLPSGVVRGTQPFLSVSLSGDMPVGPAGGGAPLPPWQASASFADRLDEAAAPFPSALPTHTAALVGRYALRGGPAQRSGVGPAADLRYGGLVFRRALSGDWAGLQPYWSLSAAGSLTAQYAGYAELLGGLGLQFALPFAPSLSLRAEAGVGSGGAGAALDTGGGLLRKASAGLSWRAGSQLTLSGSAGRVASHGRLDATDLRLELGWSGWDAVPGARRTTGPAPSALAWMPWTASAGVIQYARAAREGGGSPGLAVTTLKLERELEGGWRLVGQAAIGVSGNAGGYATGQLGLGWLTPPRPDSPWRTGAELTLGAAGGGAVQVGGGLIGQAQWQLRRSLSRDWSLQAEAGWLRSRQGTLSTPFAGLSAVYAFSRLQGLP